MHKTVLADFLRRKRLDLEPAAVGLDPTRRRRTTGARREEVAALANISANFYTRLEQGRGARPSEQTALVLARALQLTPDERDYLLNLAGHTPPRVPVRKREASPELLRLLPHIDVPAQIVTDLGITLAQNPSALALVGDQTQYRGPRRSIIYRWFTDPEQRRIHPDEDHFEISRSHVASLRAVCFGRVADTEASDLLAQLLRDSREFKRLWERHEVSSRSGMRKRFLHPTVGTIPLDCHYLTGSNVGERLVIFAPPPGTDSAERLQWLLADTDRQPSLRRAIE